MFIRFDRMYERDGHTDRQTHTPYDSIGRAGIASRGKNRIYMLQRYYVISNFMKSLLLTFIDSNYTK